MKKGFIFFVSFILVSSFTGRNAMSQDEVKDFHFTIKTNPLAALGGPFFVTVIPITGEYKIVLESKTYNKQSLQVGLSYVGPSVIVNLEEISDSIAAISVGGYRIQGMYKFYITSSDQSLEGFYVAPHFSYASAKIKDKNRPDDYINATKFNIHGVLGYQILTSGGFALDIYSGFGYRTLNWSYGNPTSTDFTELSDNSRINVTLGFSFGYAF